MVFLSAITLSFFFIGQVFAASDTAGSLLDFTADSPSAGKATITGRSSGNTNAGITIPSTVTAGATTYSVTSIGTSAFYNNSLTSVTIANSVTSIGVQAFRANSLTSVIIPDSVNSIGNIAFYDNSLISVTIPDSVTSLGSYAFANNSLASLTIGNSVTSIEFATFYNNSLTSVTIGNSVNSIGIYAFYNNSLTSVTIPNSVTSIGYSAFRINDLTSVTIPDSVISIGDRAFENNSLTNVLFKGDYHASFATSIFDINSTLTSINAELGTMGWAGITFSNGSSLIPVVFLVVPTDAKPVANPGKDITLVGYNDNRTIILDGSASSDEEGSIKQYIWYRVEGNALYLISKSSSQDLKLTLQNGRKYIYLLEVVDSVGNKSDIYNFKSRVNVNLVKFVSVIPKVPQQSISTIIRTDNIATDASISIGASSDDGATSNTTFTTDDEVTLTAKVYPASDDVGEEGELYVVMRSAIDGKKTFTALNQDGVWEAWNASLKSLPAAKYVESLESVEEILIYSGTITASDRIFYVGYSLFTSEGKPVITTSVSPFKITVSE